MLDSALVPLLLALLLDLALGDPPDRYDPVAWMGTVIGLTPRAAPPGIAGSLCSTGRGWQWEACWW